MVRRNVFGPNATTEEVYDVTARPVVKLAMDGFNGYTIETVEVKRISVDHVLHLKPADGGSAATQCQPAEVSEDGKEINPHILPYSPLLLGISIQINPYRILLVRNAYYRRAMGILLVYDVTDESSFNNIRNCIRNIEQYASDNVNKILAGNKAGMDESKMAVPTTEGQTLVDEYGIKFFETSAKTNLNVEEVFYSKARDIKQRLADTDTKQEEEITGDWEVGNGIWIIAAPFNVRIEAQLKVSFLLRM